MPNKTTSMIDKIESQYETINPLLPHPSAGATIAKKLNENSTAANATPDCDRSDNRFQNRKHPANSNSRNKHEQTTSCKFQRSAPRNKLQMLCKTQTITKQ